MLIEISHSCNDGVGIKKFQMKMINSLINALKMWDLFKKKRNELCISFLMCENCLNLLNGEK